MPATGFRRFPVFGQKLVLSRDCLAISPIVTYSTGITRFETACSR